MLEVRARRVRATGKIAEDDYHAGDDGSTNRRYDVPEEGNTRKLRRELIL